MTAPNSSHDASRRHSWFTIASVVLFYWTVSISMVFANKYLVGDRTSKDDLSIFVAWVQCVSAVLTVIVYAFFIRFFFKSKFSSLPNLLDLKLLYKRDMIFLGLTFTCMLVFNNLCLKFVGVAFFQVARSLTLIFTVILSAIILRKISSFRVILCCLLVVIGFGLGVDQEKLAGTLSMQGIFFGVVTSLFVALNGIFVKRVLSLVQTSSYGSLTCTYYMNLCASVLMLVPLIISGQLQIVLITKATDFVFLTMLVVSGLLSFFIGFASNLEIDYTSPVTHHISNNSKSVVQTIIAVLVYQEFKSFLWWCSNLLVVFGALSYTLVRMKEESNAARVRDSNKTGNSEPQEMIVKVESKIGDTKFSST